MEQRHFEYTEERMDVEPRFRNFFKRLFSCSSTPNISEGSRNRPFKEKNHRLRKKRQGSTHYKSSSFFTSKQKSKSTNRIRTLSRSSQSSSTSTTEGCMKEKVSFHPEARKKFHNSSTFFYMEPDANDRNRDLWSWITMGSYRPNSERPSSWYGFVNQGDNVEVIPLDKLNHPYVMQTFQPLPTTTIPSLPKNVCQDRLVTMEPEILIKVEDIEEDELNREVESYLGDLENPTNREIDTKSTEVKKSVGQTFETWNKIEAERRVESKDTQVFDTDFEKVKDLNVRVNEFERILAKLASMPSDVGTLKRAKIELKILHEKRILIQEIITNVVTEIRLKIYANQKNRTYETDILDVEVELKNVEEHWEKCLSQLSFITRSCDNAFSYLDKYHLAFEDDCNWLDHLDSQLISLRNKKSFENYSKDEEIKLVYIELDNLQSWLIGVESELRDPNFMPRDFQALALILDLLQRKKFDIQSRLRNFQKISRRTRETESNDSQVISTEKLNQLKLDIKNMHDRAENLQTFFDDLTNLFALAHEELKTFDIGIDSFEKCMGKAAKKLEFLEGQWLKNNSKEITELLSDVLMHKADLKLLTATGQNSIEHLRGCLKMLSESKAIEEEDTMCVLQTNILDKIGQSTSMHKDIVLRLEKLIEIENCLQAFQEAFEVASKFLEQIQKSFSEIESRFEGSIICDNEIIHQLKSISDEAVPNQKLIENFETNVEKLLHLVRALPICEDIQAISNRVELLKSKSQKLTDSIDKKLTLASSITFAWEDLKNGLFQAQTLIKKSERQIKLVEMSNCLREELFFEKLAKLTELNSELDVLSKNVNDSFAFLSLKSKGYADISHAGLQIKLTSTSLENLKSKISSMLYFYQQIKTTYEEFQDQIQSLNACFRKILHSRDEDLEVARQIMDICEKSLKVYEAKLFMLENIPAFTSHKKDFEKVNLTFTYFNEFAEIRIDSLENKKTARNSYNSALEETTFRLSDLSGRFQSLEKSSPYKDSQISKLRELQEDHTNCLISINLLKSEASSYASTIKTFHKKNQVLKKKLTSTSLVDLSQNDFVEECSESSLIETQIFSIDLEYDSLREMISCKVIELSDLKKVPSESLDKLCAFINTLEGILPESTFPIEGNQCQQRIHLIKTIIGLIENNNQLMALADSWLSDYGEKNQIYLEVKSKNQTLKEIKEKLELEAKDLTQFLKFFELDDHLKNWMDEKERELERCSLEMSEIDSQILFELSNNFHSYENDFFKKMDEMKSVGKTKKALLEGEQTTFVEERITHLEQRWNCLVEKLTIYESGVERENSKNSEHYILIGDLVRTVTKFSEELKMISSEFPTKQASLERLGESLDSTQSSVKNELMKIRDGKIIVDKEMKNKYCDLECRLNQCVEKIEMEIKQVRENEEGTKFYHSEKERFSQMVISLRSKWSIKISVSAAKEVLKIQVEEWKFLCGEIQKLEEEIELTILKLSSSAKNFTSDSLKGLLNSFKEIQTQISNDKDYAFGVFERFKTLMKLCTEQEKEFENFVHWIEKVEIELWSIDPLVLDKMKLTRLLKKIENLKVLIDEKSSHFQSTVTVSENFLDSCDSDKEDCAEKLIILKDIWEQVNFKTKTMEKSILCALEVLNRMEKVQKLFEKLEVKAMEMDFNQDGIKEMNILLQELRTMEDHLIPLKDIENLAEENDFRHIIAEIENFKRALKSRTHGIETLLKDVEMSVKATEDLNARKIQIEDLVLQLCRGFDEDEVDLIDNLSADKTHKEPTDKAYKLMSDFVVLSDHFIEKDLIPNPDLLRASVKNLQQTMEKLKRKRQSRDEILDTLKENSSAFWKQYGKTIKLVDEALLFERSIYKTHDQMKQVEELQNLEIYILGEIEETTKRGQELRQALLAVKKADSKEVNDGIIHINSLWDKLTLNLKARREEINAKLLSDQRDQELLRQNDVWLKEVSEMLLKQTNPSSNPSVVEIQIQEQKLVQIILKEQHAKIYEMKNMSNPEINFILMQYQGLKEKSVERMNTLSEILGKSLKFEEKVINFESWFKENFFLLEDFEKSLAQSRGPLKHLRDMILEKKSSIEDLSDLASNLIETVDHDDGEDLAKKVENITGMYEELVNKTLALDPNDCLFEEEEVQKVFSLCQFFFTWMETVEESLSQFQFLSTVPGQLLDQIEKLNTIAEDVLAHSQDLDEIEEDAEEIWVQFTNEEEDYLKHRLKEGRESYESLARLSANRLKSAEEMLIMVNNFQQSCNKLHEWLNSVENSFQSLSSKNILEHNWKIRKLNEDLSLYQEVLDKVILIGCNLCQQTPESNQVKNAIPCLKEKFKYIFEESQGRARKYFKGLVVETDKLHNWLVEVEKQFVDIDDTQTTDHQIIKTQLILYESLKSEILDQIENFIQIEQFKSKLLEQEQSELKNEHFLERANLVARLVCKRLDVLSANHIDNQSDLESDLEVAKSESTLHMPENSIDKEEELFEMDHMKSEERSKSNKDETQTGKSKSKKQSQELNEPDVMILELNKKNSDVLSSSLVNLETLSLDNLYLEKEQPLQSSNQGFDLIFSEISEENEFMIETFKRKPQNNKESCSLAVEDSAMSLNFFPNNSSDIQTEWLQQIENDVESRSLEVQLVSNLDSSHGPPQEMDFEIQQTLTSIIDLEKSFSALEPQLGLQDEVEKFSVLKDELEGLDSKVSKLLKTGNHILKQGSSEGLHQFGNLLKNLEFTWCAISKMLSEKIHQQERLAENFSEFFNSLNIFIDWLSSAEYYLTFSPTTTRDFGAISIQIEQHIEFQLKLASKRGELKTFENCGNELLLLSNEIDATVIKNIISSVRQRWEGVVSSSALKTEALDICYQESKYFQEASNLLCDWLENAKENLENFSDVYLEEPEVLKQIIIHHGEFQKTLSSKRVIFDALVNSNEYIPDLKSKWFAVCELSINKQKMLVNAAIQSRKFFREFYNLKDFLTTMSIKFSKNFPVHGDLFKVNQLFDVHKKLESELLSKSGKIDALRQEAEKVFSRNKTKSNSKVQISLKTLLKLWEEVLCKSSIQRRSLEEALEQAEEFQKLANIYLEKVSYAEKQLRFPGPFPKDKKEVEQQILVHCKLVENIQDLERLKNRLELLGSEICSKCSSDSSESLLQWMTVIDSRWKEIFQWSEERSENLQKLLRKIEDVSGVINELENWMAFKINDLKFSEERISLESPVGVEFLISQSRYIFNHSLLEVIQQQLWKDTENHGKKKKLNLGTVKLYLESHPEVTNSWYQLKERALSFENRSKNKLKDEEEMKNFKIEKWKEKFLAHFDYKKVQVTTMFKMIDKKGDGLIEKDDFVNKILQLEIGTTRLEAIAIANSFTQYGDDMIDWREFVAFLQPDWQEKALITCVKRIEFELERQTSTCSCMKKFKVFQFGDSKKLLLVRVLKSTVMVRVGGGWTALEEYLLKNDPCRVFFGDFSTSNIVHDISCQSGFPRHPKRSSSRVEEYTIRHTSTSTSKDSARSLSLEISSSESGSPSYNQKVQVLSPRRNLCDSSSNCSDSSCKKYKKRYSDSYIVARRDPTSSIHSEIPMMERKRNFSKNGSWKPERISRHPKL